MGTQPFADKLRLKGLAEEDIYFARKDRELIEALHRRRLAEHAGCDSPGQEKRARKYEKRFHRISRRHQEKPKKRLKAWRKLLRRIREKCHLH
ncbi:MAG TPA: hypothetical protein ENK50_05760 [Sedimenticola sp.]|nr:hypothetical protein [Sedimenticola sp.]